MKFKHEHLHQVKNVLTFTSRIIEKIPKKDDTLLNKVLKGVSIVDSLYETLNAGKSGIESMIDTKECDYVNSGLILRLLDHEIFKENMKEEIRYFSEKDWVKIYTYRDWGKLYYHYDGRNLNYLVSGFWVPKTFDLEGMFSYFWDQYNGIMSLKTSGGELYSRLLDFRAIDLGDDPWIGSAAGRLEDFVRGHARFVRDGVSRTYLFVGKPGTGKSTFGLRAGQRFGKVIRVDAEQFVHNHSDIGVLMSYLEPNFLIVDDLDRAPSFKPSMLNSFAEFKEENPSIGIIFTVNDESKLDSAFKRPGRIDSILDFCDLEDGDRMAILKGYLPKDFSWGPEMDEILNMTESLSPAYLKEIAIQLRYESVGEVKKLIHRMMKTASENTVVVWKPSKEEEED